MTLEIEDPDKQHDELHWRMFSAAGTVQLRSYGTPVPGEQWTKIPGVLLRSVADVANQ